MASSEKIVLKGRSRRALDRLGKFGPTKIRLDDSVDETTRKIARAYGRAWQVTRGEARSMAEYAAEQFHLREGISARDVARMDRVDRAMHSLERQVRDLDRYTGVQVLGGAHRQIQRDVDTTLNALADLTGLDRRFTRPTGGAMEALILRSTGRIESATRRLDATQATALKDGLIRGLVLGENPRETARHIYRQTEGAFFGGLNRATTIAGTEIADAHRYANRLAYGEHPLVVGWKWLAQLDTRTCPACWSMHNTRHEKESMQFGHQRCRCTMVPILADDEPADHDLGDPEEIFWSLDRADQLAIMGPGRLKALEAGVRWTDLTHLKPNPGWRPSQAVTRVSDLAGIAELNTATTPGDIITIPGQTNASVLSMAYTQGGMTIHALTGEQPTSGYVVARKGTSLVVDAREFFGPKGPAEMAAWMRRHGDRLDEPGAHVGMWYDTANGKVVLDVVEILPDRDAAVALGRAEDQIAIFDLNTFTEIQTGGTGGYADPLTSAIGATDIGRTATIVRGDSEWSGTVVAAGEWGVRIKTADGDFVNGSPEQVLFTGKKSDAVVERAKQIDDIERSATHGIPVEYGQADPKVAQALDDSVADVSEDWPAIKPTKVAVAADDVGGAFAVTNTGFDPILAPDGTLTMKSDSEIEVSRGYASDHAKWQADMAGAESRGHFHRGTSDEPVDYSFDHEYGHVLTMRLFGDPRFRPGAKARAEVVAEIYNRLYAKELQAWQDQDGVDLRLRTDTDEEIRRVMEAWNSNPDFRFRLTNDLSGYGASDPDEMMAEGFAVYRDHGPGESVAADAIMKALVNAYIKQVGSLPGEDGIAQLLGIDPNQLALFDLEEVFS